MCEIDPVSNILFNFASKYTYLCPATSYGILG